MSENELSMSTRVDASNWLETSSALCDWTYTYSYPSWGHTVVHRDDFETAFNIVGALIEKGHIKGLTVKKFIEVVKEVQKEL